MTNEEFYNRMSWAKEVFQDYDKRSAYIIALQTLWAAESQYKYDIMSKNSMGTDFDGNAMTTQRKVIFNELLKGREITQLEVSNVFGFTRLSSIIFDLKKMIVDEGMNFAIRDRYDTGVNRYGNPTRYKRYWLEILPR